MTVGTKLHELNARIESEMYFVNELLTEINKVVVGQETLIERGSPHCWPMVTFY
jgi:hypothetical protein